MSALIASMTGSFTSCRFMTFLVRKVRFPVTCFIMSFAIFTVIPSVTSLKSDFSVKGISLFALAGLVENEVNYNFINNEVSQKRVLAPERIVSIRKTGVIERIEKNLKKDILEMEGNTLPYLAMIDKIAKANGVSPALAAAVIKVESGFKSRAVSSRGARGLMQVLPATARRVGVKKDINDPEHNLRAGIRYLKLMLDRYNGDEKLALAAYNAGPGAVDKYRRIPPYRETQRYVPRVLAYFEEYKRYFQDS